MELHHDYFFRRVVDVTTHCGHGVTSIDGGKLPPIPPADLNLGVHIIHTPCTIDIVDSITVHPTAVDGAGIYLRRRFHQQVQLVVVYQVVFHAQLTEGVVACYVIDVGVGI